MDEYFDRLENFYYRTRKTEKEWEELSYWEISQIERDYESYKEGLMEQLRPDYYYGLIR